MLQDVPSTSMDIPLSPFFLDCSFGTSQPLTKIIVFYESLIPPHLKALTFSHQVHGSWSSLAYLQYRRGTPVNHRGIGTVPSALMILRSSGDHF
ncbi:hypothetical protein CDAR_249441 [Caerostris darwini]|uniref:Cytochrome c biogenesis B n=1 Tax=Caerostris darwini TaxID=1538125 RepID=A0AAV4VG40_9ARAC|nr:hypothetical protein CDAR_249441 [Caerostris darwini]